MTNLQMLGELTQANISLLGLASSAIDEAFATGGAFNSEADKVKSAEASGRYVGYKMAIGRIDDIITKLKTSMDEEAASTL